MSWNDKYWDIVHQYYWSPAYLGLQSIPNKLVERHGDQLILPAEQLPTGARLYTRRTNFADTMMRLQRLEEPLNDFFDITLAIAPDEVISQLLHRASGLADTGPFVNYGKEICHRFGWGEENITMQDGFFVSERSVLGVELKLGSATRPDQLIKYMTLVVAEEMVDGPKEEISLLFITPPMDSEKLWRQCGLSSGQIDDDFINRAQQIKLNSFVKAQIDERPEQFASVTRRMKFAHITWSMLCDEIDRILSGLDCANMGEQAVSRLLGGFRRQISQHAGTGVVDVRANRG